MAPVRVLAVRYLNTVPLIEGLEKARELELRTAVPSRIAPAIRAGEADIGLASLIDAAATPPGEPDLALLPVGMIGCDGPTLTVRLFSSAPLGELHTVHADTDSHTSVVLCRVLLHRLFGVKVNVVEYDARERIAVTAPSQPSPPDHDAGSGEWPEALLMIGDKVVTDSPPAVRYPHQMDLGEAWKSLTGLPFVYATWMCRAADLDTTNGAARLGLAASLLDRQLRHNLTRLNWVIDVKAPEHRWPTDLARRYIAQLLRYQLGERERAGAERFIAEAASIGLVPARSLRWADLTTCPHSLA